MTPRNGTDSVPPKAISPEQRPCRDAGIASPTLRMRQENMCQRGIPESETGQVYWSLGD